MATENVLFVGWHAPHPGRDKMAVELFGTAQKYWAKLKDMGTIESYENVLLSYHGGDLGGFTMLRGGRDQLTKLLYTEEFEDLLMQISQNVSGVGAVPGWTGEGVTKVMGRYTRFAKS